eukprot:gene26464-31985_t
MLGSFCIVEKVPAIILNKLKNAQDVKVAKVSGEGKSSFLQIDITESTQGTLIWEEWLSSGGSADPMISPFFGPPLNSFVGPLAQTEVHHLLSTFQPLLAPSLTPGAPPIPFVAGPVVAAYNYRGNISISQVRAEIQNPLRFPALCPAITALPGGQVLCDLSITYANCMIMDRLRRA